MKYIATVLALTASFAAAPAFARGAPDTVSGMIGAIGELGADIAPAVSGRNATENGSGWGNNAGVSGGATGAAASGENGK